MELDNKKDKRTEFKITCGDDKLILKVIEVYNKTYGKDFKIEKFIYDEVVIALISVSEFKLKDIFNLGMEFGGYIENKRTAKEIDW